MIYDIRALERLTNPVVHLINDLFKKTQKRGKWYCGDLGVKSHYHITSSLVSFTLSDPLDIHSNKPF